MISKQKFCEAIEQLKKANVIQELIDDILKEVPEGADFMCGYGTAINHECLVVDLLEILMNDNDGFIAWWLWEMDYGRKVKPDSVMVNGEPRDIRNPGGLYDFMEEWKDEA